MSNKQIVKGDENFVVGGNYTEGVPIEQYTADMKNALKDGIEIGKDLSGIDKASNDLKVKNLQDILETEKSTKIAHKAHILALKQQVSELEKLGGEQSGELIDSAKAALSNGDPIKAEQFYKSVILKAEKESEFAGQAAFNMATIHQENFEYRKAYELYEKAINFNPTNPEYYNGSGIMLLMLKDYGEKGIAYLMQAKNLFDKKYGKKHPKYAEVINNIAGFQYKTNDYSSAINTYRTALSIYQELYDDSNQLTIACLIGILNCLRDTRCYDEAITLLEDTHYEVSADNMLTIAALLQLEGMIHFDLNNLKEAKKCLVQSLLYSEESAGKEHPLTIYVQLNISALASITDK